MLGVFVFVLVVVVLAVAVAVLGTNRYTLSSSVPWFGSRAVSRAQHNLLEIILSITFSHEPP